LYKQLKNELITQLSDNEVFVFGSNESGFHSGGAAKTAIQWGAVYGQAFSLQGKTFAIPTVKKFIKGKLEINKIADYVNRFIDFTKTRKDLDFLVTEIGCGLAGYSVSDIAPLFKGCDNLDNVYLPKSFVEYLNKN